MLKMYVKMLKINMFKMGVWTFWSPLSSFYALYTVPVLGISISLKSIGQFGQT